MPETEELAVLGAVVCFYLLFKDLRYSRRRLRRYLRRRLRGRRRLRVPDSAATRPAQHAVKPPPRRAFGSARSPRTISGRARVTDGDGILVSGEEIRFVGLDAPEWDQVAKHRDGYWFNHELACVVHNELSSRPALMYGLCPEPQGSL